MELTGAFDNMPVCVAAVRRSLEKKDGFEEIYLNNALKAKTNLIKNSDRGVLLNIFQDRYAELKQVITDIFDGIKKTEVISSYNEELGGYFSAEFYIAGEPDYCICVFREEMELVGSRSILNAIKNLFYVISLCDMEKDEIYIFEQKRGTEHDVCKKVNYTQYVSDIIEKIVARENVEDIVRFMSKENIRKNLSEEKKIISMEYKRYINSEDMFLWSRMSFIWLSRDENGMTKECVMTVKDIHEEKVKEIMQNKSLECAYDVTKAANEAKNAFLQHIGHYMKTPVNYIIGITDMLWASKKYYNDNERYIGKIRSASDVLMENINKILDVGKIEIGNTKLLYEKISFSKLIKEVIRESEEAFVTKGHQINISLDGIEHDNVYIDKMRLKQIIKNIILNAVQYTDEKGKISVTVIEGKQKFGELSIYDIIIEDNGPGIEKQYVDNALKSIIMEQPDKLGEHGIGLGLWLAKNMIRVLNGDLKIESSQGAGTKCTISVPLSTDKNYFQEEYELPEDNALSYIMNKNNKNIKKILIVQNLITARNTLRQKLVCLGFDVECAATGREALFMYNEKGEGYYTAIITDAQLPEMSGYELALEIRKREKKMYLPIIAMSKSHYIEDNVFSKEMGITLHIGKDADISVLKAAFEKIKLP